ncbi:MAG: TolC family protein [Acidobacteriota bacterium]
MPVRAGSTLLRVAFAAALLAGAPASHRAQADSTVLTPAGVEALLLEGAPETRASEAWVEAARGGLSSARIPPDVTLILGRSDSTDRFSPLSSRDTQAALQWDLPAPWFYAASLRRAGAEVEVALADRQRTDVSLRASARRLVGDLLAAQERAQILSAQREFLRDLSALTSLRVKAGEGREFDRLRTLVELERMEAEASRAEAGARGLREALARLSGNRLPEGFTVEGRLGIPPEAPGAQAAAELAASRNPDLRLAAARSLRARKELTLQRTAASPSLFASAERARDVGTRATTLSLGLRIPLWNANRGGIRTARADLVLAEAEEEAVRRQVGARVIQTASLYAAVLSSARRSAAEALPAARRAMDLADFSYRQGETSLLDALDARRALQAAALEDVALRHELHGLYLDLDVLTGGALAPPWAPEAPSAAAVGGPRPEKES